MLWHRRRVFLGCLRAFLIRVGVGQGVEPRPVHGRQRRPVGRVRVVHALTGGRGAAPRSPDGDPADRRIGLCFVILARRAPAPRQRRTEPLQNERSELKGCSEYTSSKTATLAG